MNRGISPVQPEVWTESLDIDLDTLDHALMDLLTSDWQSLDDSEAPDTVLEPRQLSPAA